MNRLFSLLPGLLLLGGFSRAEVAIAREMLDRQLRAIEAAEDTEPVILGKTCPRDPASHGHYVDPPAARSCVQANPEKDPAEQSLALYSPELSHRFKIRARSPASPIVAAHSRARSGSLAPSKLAKRATAASRLGDGSSVPSHSAVPT